MTSAFLKVSVDREEACPFTLFFLRGGGGGFRVVGEYGGSLEVIST